MANHPSALKRARANRKKRLNNRYQRKSATTFLKSLSSTAGAAKEGGREVGSGEGLQKAYAMVDKLAKKGIIHKNKAARLKARAALKVGGVKP